MSTDSENGENPEDAKPSAPAETHGFLSQEQGFGHLMKELSRPKEPAVSTVICKLIRK